MRYPSVYSNFAKGRIAVPFLFCILEAPDGLFWNLLGLSLGGGAWTPCPPKSAHAVLYDYTSVSSAIAGSHRVLS